MEKKPLEVVVLSNQKKTPKLSMVSLTCWCHTAPPETHPGETSQRTRVLQTVKGVWDRPCGVKYSDSFSAVIMCCWCLELENLLERPLRLMKTKHASETGSPSLNRHLTRGSILCDCFLYWKFKYQIALMNHSKCFFGKPQRKLESSKTVARLFLSSLYAQPHCSTFAVEAMLIFDLHLHFGRYEA